MSERLPYRNRKKGKSKKFVIFTITALLLIGGSISAFVLLNFSEKQKYFLAEKKSFEVFGEQIENRFEPELTWNEKAKEHPTESTIELSATYNDPNANLTAFGPAQIINNSTITINSQTDLEEKKMAAEISGAFGGITVDGLNLYLTSDKLLLSLPFLEELLQIKEADASKLLKELNPETFTSKEKIDFDTFFKGSRVLSEEDQEYLKDEYLMMFYEELPDSAFKAAEEKIEVNSETINTEKITFHLKEQQFKDILRTIMQKMKDDEKLMEILREQIAFQTLSTGMPSDDKIAPTIKSDIDDLIKDFETSLEKAITNLETFKIPEGLTSTIWINESLIVKRDFSITMGPSSDQLVSFGIEGTQMLEGSSQTFNYTLGVEENGQSSVLTLTGDLTWKDNKADDSIKLAGKDLEILYEGNSKLVDGKKDFERKLSFKSGVDQGALSWTGNATYKEDNMNAENTFTVQVPGMSEDILSLHVSNEAKLINQVEIPESADVKDIGGMRAEEINTYFQTEVVPQFQQWLFGVMGSSGGLNGL